MNSAHNGSVYSDSSQDEAFLFGMEPFHEFDSYSDGESENIFVDVNYGGHGGVNEPFLAEMAHFNIDNDYGKSNKDPHNYHHLSAETNSGDNVNNEMKSQGKTQYSRSSYMLF